MPVRGGPLPGKHPRGGEQGAAGQGDQGPGEVVFRIQTTVSVSVVSIYLDPGGAGLAAPPAPHRALRRRGGGGRGGRHVLAPADGARPGPGGL